MDQVCISEAAVGAVLALQDLEQVFGIGRESVRSHGQDQRQEEQSSKRHGRGGRRWGYFWFYRESGWTSSCDMAATEPRWPGFSDVPLRLLDASASLVPWSARLPRFLAAEIRHYPDRHHRVLCGCLSALHHLDPEAVLVGNGAAELFTWVAPDAAACGLSVQPAPGFADYARALNSWQGSLRQQPLPLNWASAFPTAAGSRPRRGAVDLQSPQPHRSALVAPRWSRC